MFRTELDISQSSHKMSLKDPIMTLGSCFSDCMGQRFLENKFDVVSNPFGTVYNPVSISELLTFTLKKEFPDEKSYTQTQGLWSNYHFHSSFSSSNRDITQRNIEESIITAHNQVRKAKFLIITLGTAFVYKRNDTKSIVANCHKIPQRNFTKELLTQRQILTSLEPIIKDIPSNIHVIFTVSPVRHLKDTLEQNTVSKSTLRLVCDTLSQNNDHVSYFPSYEIMMDDLRDYRFYKRDMLHPSEEAEDYIWDKFSKTYFSNETTVFLTEWAKIKSALAHRPFNPTSENHQQFIKKSIHVLEQLKTKVDVQSELTLFKKQLI